MYVERISPRMNMYTLAEVKHDQASIIISAAASRRQTTGADMQACMQAKVKHDDMQL